ncbi:MAG: hypothetical protein GXO80_10320 [Chlorobi bacterium]|nr:hypothetical protein [Chlorobiota bacterium]
MEKLEYKFVKARRIGLKIFLIIAILVDLWVIAVGINIMNMRFPKSDEIGAIIAISGMFFLIIFIISVIGAFKTLYKRKVVEIKEENTQ